MVVMSMKVPPICRTISSAIRGISPLYLPVSPLHLSLYLADLPHHLLRHPIEHVDVVPAVPVRLARVVDRLGQRPLLDGVLGLRVRVRVRVRANPYLNPNLDGVAVLVADVTRDNHDLP